MTIKKHISKYILEKLPSAVLILCFIFSGFDLNAQVQKEREVVSSGGGSAQNNTINVSYTIGEPVVTTEVGNGITISQGFEQIIDSSALISFELSVMDASCEGKRNGRAFVSNISGCQPPYDVIWSAGNNPADTFSTVGILAGNYSVQIQSSDGCTSDPLSFTIGLIDPNPCLLIFYSGITPNNDGINDSWIIDNVDVFPENEVAIFNRLGNKVWEGSDYDNNNTLWEGQNLSGNELPSDTYFYVFEAKGEVEKGWIELSR